jgi:hypothetical protein
MTNYAGWNGASNYTFNVILPVGNYQWKSYGNDTSNNQNVTYSWNFSISQNQTNPIDIYFINSTGTYKNQNITTVQGQQSTANSTMIYTQSGTALLWEDGSSVSNPRTTILSLGLHSYKGNTSGDGQNYTTNNTGATYYVNVTPPGILIVNLLYPPTGSTTSVPQNSTFNVNASVTCTGGSCGTVYGTVRYNGSSSNPDTPVNSTKGDKPFYNTSGAITQSCGNMNQNDFCQLNWTVNATGNAISGYKIGVLFNASYNSVIQNHTNNATVKILGQSNTWLYLNWTQGDRIYNKPNIAYIYANCTGCSSGSNISLEANYTGTLSPISHSHDTGQNNAYAYTDTSNLALGSYLIRASTSADQDHFDSQVNYTLTVVDQPPTYSLNSTNSTTAGTPVMHSLNWTDNVGLSGYIFQFCNGTWNGTNCLGESGNWWNASWNKRIRVNISETTGIARSYEPIDIWINFTTKPINATKEVRVTQCNAETTSPCTAETEINSQVYNTSADKSSNMVFEANVSANSWRLYYIYYNYSATFPSYTSDLVSNNATGWINNTNYNLQWDATNGRIANTIRIKNSAWTESTTYFSDNFDSVTDEPLRLTPNVTGPVFVQWTVTNGGATARNEVIYAYANSPWMKLKYNTVSNARYMITSGIAGYAFSCNGANPSTTWAATCNMQKYYSINSTPTVFWATANLTSGAFPAGIVTYSNYLAYTGDGGTSFVAGTIAHMFDTSISNYNQTYYTLINPLSYSTGSEESVIGWVNDTWNSTNFNGLKSAWSNVTKVVNSKANAWIAWCVYANDTSNNWNRTSCDNPFTYNTTQVNRAKIWNLAVRNSYTGNKIDQTVTGVAVIISVNVSGDINYVEGNFTWPNGTIVMHNLTLNVTDKYTHNWTYTIPLDMPYSNPLPNASINVTAYDIYGSSNSTNTTLIILETVELTLLNNPVNFSVVKPGQQVNATSNQGWPLYVNVKGNTVVNLSQNASAYLTGRTNPSVQIKIENVTWNTSNYSQAIFTQMSTNYIFINKTTKSFNQSIYYKLFVPPVQPQDYGGLINIKGEGSS